MKNKVALGVGALIAIGALGIYDPHPLMAQVRAALVSDVDNPARYPVASEPDGDGQ